jgi:hypothetical protein
MRTHGFYKTGESRWRCLMHVAKALVFLVLALLIYADFGSAQVVPGRLNMLQDIRPVSPPPVPQVERLRQDIIRAVNPRTGTIDVRRLAAPALPSRPGPGSTVGFEQVPILSPPSRPGSGTTVPVSQTSSPPSASREELGSIVGSDQPRMVKKKGVRDPRLKKPKIGPPFPSSQ